MEFESAERSPEAAAFPNWPGDPRILDTELSKELEQDGFETISQKRTEYGTAGARRFEIFLTNLQKNLVVKWKEMPPKELDGYNHSPRKTLAAYELQKFFLDPEDYVVPTELAFCVHLDRYESSTGEAHKPTFENTGCVLGVISVWLRDVTTSETLYDEERFASDPVYAYYMSNFNLFTYLAEHKDAKMSNFLVSKNDQRRQVFSIDHDITFEPFFHNPAMTEWSAIFVPALRQDSIERLRKLRREDLDSLGVVAELKKDERGIFVSVPLGENLSPNVGIRFSGDTIQLGLARYEIEGVWQRIQGLLERVDSGEIVVF